jgi:ATP-dependent DNA helicase RecG
VDSPIIREFLDHYSPSTDPLDFAISGNLIDRVSFKPRVAGLLLFSQNPSSLIPRKCSVRISRYDTKEDEPDREHLGPIESVEGPLHQLAFKTAERVSSIMSGISIWTVDGPKSLTFPPETIWEIVVNALIHRDFSISDDVHIHIYNNRIEVISPGKLPGYVTAENILNARYARNSKIVNLLSKYRVAPNKDIGEGLDTAFKKMKEWRMKDPIVEEIGNTVKVTIPHAPLAAPQEAIMEFLTKNDQITNRQARDITGIRSENAMKSEFYKLRDAGVIEMIPELKGNKAAWRKKLG